MNLQRNNTIIGTITLLVYLLLFLGFGQQNFQEIHDSLEYFVPNLRSAILCGDLWQLNPNGHIESLMSGVPRHCFHNGIDFHTVIFSVLDPFPAYALNFILVHTIAFIGFFLLFRDFLLNSNEQIKTNFQGFAGLFAATFSILPLYPLIGITFAGLPLIMWSFMRVWKNQRFSFLDIFIVFVFAFYSSFVYIGVFVLIVTGLIATFKTIQSRQLQTSLFLWIICLASLYAILNYYLIFQVLFARDFVSHRDLWIPKGFNWKVTIWSAYDMFTNGHYHAASFHQLTILLCFLFIFLVFRNKYWGTPSVKTIIRLLLIIVIFAGFFAFMQWHPIAQIKEKIRILKIFKWERFYFFNPLLWTILFTLITIWIASQFQKRKLSNAIVYILSAIQCSYFISQDPIALQNVVLYTEKITPLQEEFKAKLLGVDHFTSYKSKTGTFEGFYQEETFKAIARRINKPFNEYRVGCIGVNPALTLYNGFYTIDGYMTSYPISHKLDIQQVISNEIDTNSKDLEKFDSWGSRCNLLFEKKDCNQPEGCELNYDFQKLKSMKCQYLISAFKLKESGSLMYIETFDSQINSAHFYLYEVL